MTTDNPDRLARRQSIIDGFKTPFQLAERIMQLEDECHEANSQRDEARWSNAACHFSPEHHYKFGHVTHMRALGEMNGYFLSACVVCGSVRAEEPVALAAGDSPPITEQ